MRITVLISMMMLTACIFDIRTKSQQDRVQVVDAFFELQVLYHLAFEKHIYVNLEGLYDLEQKTARALHDNTIPSAHVERVKKWHHKLRSYIIFLLAMRPIDDNGIIKTKMSSLLLHQLRSESPDHIDLTLSKQSFYQDMRQGKVSTMDFSEESVQKFFANFITTVMSVTEQTISKYQSLFTFEPHTLAGLCYQAGYDGCQRFEIGDNTAQDGKTAELENVMMLVNTTANSLNKIITNLQLLETHKPVHDKEEKRQRDEIHRNIQYQKYELILLKAAQQGILPIFFTDVFKEKSGSVQLDITENFQHADNKLLTEITATALRQAVVELKKELLVHWHEIKKIQQHHRKLSERDMYIWASNNEVATARLLVQSPEYAPVVSYLFHKYEHKVNDRKFHKIVKATLTTVGLGTLGLFAMSFTPIFPINAALSKAIVISAAANFGWIGLNLSESVVAHSRHLMMERALLSGTSQQIGENLKMLQEFEAARKNAILSGVIGLTMTAASYNQVLKSLNSSSRPFISNYIQDLFKPKTNTDGE